MRYPFKPGAHHMVVFDFKDITAVKIKTAVFWGVMT
jgi:hypothetical protein